MKSHYLFLTMTDLTSFLEELIKLEQLVKETVFVVFFFWDVILTLKVSLVYLSAMLIQYNSFQVYILWECSNCVIYLDTLIGNWYMTIWNFCKLRQFLSN